MKRLVALILAVCTAFSLVGCGGGDTETVSPEASSSPEVEDPKEYYEDSFYESLETFTSVTGIELNIKEDSADANAVLYNYLMDNDATGNGTILKYQSYLKDYGFEEEKDENETDESYRSYIYRKDGRFVYMSCGVPQINIIQCIVAIPHAEKTVEKPETPTSTAPSPSPSPEVDIAALYSEFCALVDDEKFSEAVDYFLDNRELTQEYSDAENYLNYAKAMQLWRETQFLSFADIQTVIELLTESNGFKDSDEIVEKINSDLNLLAGHYFRVELDGYGIYLAYDILIGEDGSIGRAAINEKNEEPYYLNYELAYLNLEKNSCYAIGDAYFPDFDKCEYSILDFDDDSITVISNDWYTDIFGRPSVRIYNGDYKRIS